MAALAYLMSTDLLAVGVESLEEAYSCLRGGALRHGKDAESWLPWVLDSCMEKKTGRQAPALHLLACTLPRCPRDVLGKNIVRLTQALRSALSPSAPPSARRLGCVCVSALVSAMKTAPQLAEFAAVVGDSSGHAELVEALPKLVLSMVACAAGDEDVHADVKVAALRSLGECLCLMTSQLKPQGSKVEAAAYRCLVDPCPSVRDAAAACLACVPLSLKDGEVWTSMVTALATDAIASLQQVWPESVVSSYLPPPSTHRPLLPPFLPPAEGPQAYALLLRRRLHGLTSALSSLLSTGYPTALTLPSPILLTLCESLLHAAPKSSSPLAPSPTSLPPAALHALLPFLRTTSASLLSSLLSAMGRSCLRSLTRLTRLSLRLLSLPTTIGLRSDAYALAERLIRVAGVATTATLVEPSLPLLLDDLTALLFTDRQAGATVVRPPPSSKKRPRPDAQSTAVTLQAPAPIVVAETQDGLSRAVVGLHLLRTLLTCCSPSLSSDNYRLVQELTARGLMDLGRGVQLITPPGSAAPSRLSAEPSLREAFVRLLTSVAVVSSPTGTGSALLPLIASVVGLLVLDPQEEVAREALHARAVVDSLLHPRACPLTVPRSLLTEPEPLEVSDAIEPTAMEVQEEEEEEVVKAEAKGGRKRKQSVDKEAQDDKKRKAAVAAEEGGKAGHAVFGESAKKVPAARKAKQPTQSISTKAKAPPAKKAEARRQEEEEDEDALPDIVDEGPDDDDSGSD